MRGLGGLLLACACTSTPEGDVLVSERVISMPHATASLPVRVQFPDAKILLTLESDTPDAMVYLDRFKGPAGRVVLRASDHWYAPHHKTNAVMRDHGLAFNWPIVPDDPALSPGVWRAAVRADAPGDAWTARILQRSRVQGAEATLPLDVSIDAQIATFPGWTEALEQALDRVNVIYAQVGLTLDTTATHTRALPSPLIAPGYGQADVWREISREAGPEAIALVVATEVLSSVDVLGVAGGIPVPTGGSLRGGVAISMLTSAGGDAVFSEAEVEQLAETIAHEVGHAIGLFHPVEIPFDPQDLSITQWDDLNDTPDCTNLLGCASSDVLGTNLMFPQPVCQSSFAGVCTALLPQQDLTPDQGALMFGSALVY